MCAMCAKKCEMYTSNAASLVNFHAFHMHDTYISSICFNAYFLPHTIWSSKERANILHSLSHCCFSPKLVARASTVRVKNQKGPLANPTASHLRMPSQPWSRLFLLTGKMKMILFSLDHCEIFSQNVGTNCWKAGACSHAFLFLFPFFLTQSSHQCGGRKCTMIGLFLGGSVQGTPSFALHIFTKHLPFSCS